MKRINFDISHLEKFKTICMSEADLLAILNDRNDFFVDKHLSKFKKDSNQYKLLHIFAYGNWNDYLQISNSLPPSLVLDPHSEAAKKLKMLTLLTLFGKERKCSYSSLFKALSIDNQVELEDLVVDLLGLELIEAKIDEVTSTVICTRACARCVPEEEKDIRAVIDKIQAIRNRIAQALKE